MKRKKRMNTRLLRRIAARIMSSPTQVDMDFWFKQDPEHAARCGTTACIAGWAVTLRDKKAAGQPLKAAVHIYPLFANGFGIVSHTNTIIRRARRALGLNPAQASRLFFTNSWPLEWANALGSATEGTKKYATIVAKRIEHFIATNGDE